MPSRRELALEIVLGASLVGVGGFVAGRMTSPTVRSESSTEKTVLASLEKQSLVIEQGQEATMLPAILKQYLKTDINQQLFQYLDTPAQNVPYDSRTQNSPAIIYQRYAFDKNHSNLSGEVFIPDGEYDEIFYNVWYPGIPVTHAPEVSATVIVDRGTGRVIADTLEFGVGANGNLMETPYVMHSLANTQDQFSYEDLQVIAWGTLLRTPSSWTRLDYSDHQMPGNPLREIVGSYGTSFSQTNVQIDSGTNVASVRVASSFSR